MNELLLIQFFDNSIQWPDPHAFAIVTVLFTNALLSYWNQPVVVPKVRFHLVPKGCPKASHSTINVCWGGGQRFGSLEFFTCTNWLCLFYADIRVFSAFYLDLAKAKVVGCSVQRWNDRNIQVSHQKKNIPPSNDPPALYICECYIFFN